MIGADSGVRRRQTPKSFVWDPAVGISSLQVFRWYEHIIWMRNNQGIAVVSIAVAVAVLAGLLVPIPFEHRAVGALSDLVHAPLFCGVTLGLLYLMERIVPTSQSNRRWLLRLFLVVVGVFIVSLATEFAQSRLGRTGTFHDAAANGLGILAAAALFSSHRHLRLRPERRSLRLALVATACLLILVAWSRPTMELIDIAKIHLESP